jgi:hypothetical protein
MKIFNIKFIVWLALSITFLISVFFSEHVNLSDESLIIAAMVLLLTLFSDLKEFNFFGLVGKKFSPKELAELEGKIAVTAKDNSVDKKKLATAENQPLQLMDTAQGNFLALAFEVERQLRIFAQASLVKDIPPRTSIVQITKDLRVAELLTDIGVKQLEAIRWARNLLVHGRTSELTDKTLDEATNIALGMYKELSENLHA